MHHKISLIVQPGDSFFPIVRAIDKAEHSINLTVFRMDDPIIQKALVEAQRRRVRVRLLIASSARGWEEKNQKLLKDAKKAGIATKEPSGDSKKARYHYKVMTVDDRWPSSSPSTRREKTCTTLATSASSSMILEWLRRSIVSLPPTGTTPRLRPTRIHHS